jgi:hypothetical protein
MSNVIRVSALAVVAGGLVWAVSGLENAGPVTHDAKSTESTIDGRTGDSGQLAARYHQRKRTKRFFKRSTLQAKPCPSEVKKVEPTLVDPGYDHGKKLAARYHLRKRTSRFFRRSIG